MITPAELQLASQLRADGASTLEVVQVIELARQASRWWSSQAIELAGVTYAASWRHELRGPHGEWISSGGTLKASVQDIGALRSQAEQEDQVRRIAREEAVRAATIAQAQYRQVHEPEEAKHEREMAAQIRQLQKQVRTANQRIAAQGEQIEGKKAKTKFWAVLSSLVGGAILGGVEAKLGTPNMAAIASSIAPAAIETLFERRKRL